MTSEEYFLKKQFPLYCTYTDMDNWLFKFVDPFQVIVINHSLYEKAVSVHKYKATNENYYWGKLVSGDMKEIGKGKFNAALAGLVYGLGSHLEHLKIEKSWWQRLFLIN